MEVGQIKEKVTEQDHKLDNLINDIKKINTNMEKDSREHNEKADKILSGVYRFRYFLGGAVISTVALAFTIVSSTLNNGLTETRKDQEILKEFFNVKYNNVEKGQNRIEKQIDQLIKIAIDGNKNK